MKRSKGQRSARRLSLELLERRNLLTAELAELSFQLFAVNSDGTIGANLDPNPNDSVVEAEVEVGDRVAVRTLVRDLRPSATTPYGGVFSAYSDFSYRDTAGRPGDRLLLQWGDSANLFIPETASSGTFRLKLGSQESAAISTFHVGVPSAFRAVLQSAIESMPSVGSGNVAVSWSAKVVNQVRGVEYSIRFEGERVRIDMPDLEIIDNQVVGSSNQPISLNVTNNSGNEVRSHAWTGIYDSTPVPSQSNQFTNGINGTWDSSNQTSGQFWIRALGGFIDSDWSNAEKFANVAVNDLYFLAGDRGTFELRHHFHPSPPNAGFGVSLLGTNHYLQESQVIWPQATIRVVERLSARPDSFMIQEDSATSVLDVLSNDRLLPGTTATIVNVTTPTTGTAEIRNGNRIGFTPAVNFFGDAFFDYTIQDNLGNRSTTRVTVNVTSLNDPPTLDPIPSFRAAHNDIAREVVLRNATAGLGEEMQPLQFEVTSSRPDLISNFVVEKESGSSTAKLRFNTIGAAEGTAVITVQVRDDEGLTTQRSFSVDVIGLEASSPLQNLPDILDVDQDAFISPLDVLIIMNRLTGRNLASIPVSDLAQEFAKLDVNGDNHVDSLDIISIIDAINDRGGGDSGTINAFPRAPKGEPLFELRYLIVDQNGENLDPDLTNGITEGLVGPGMPFLVRLMARDLRSMPAGLHSTFSDLKYTNLDGSPSARIEPFSVASNDSITGSLQTVLGGLKQGRLVDNRNSVAGQRILKGVGEFSNAAISSGSNHWHLVMSVRFKANDVGVVDLSHQLSQFAMGVPGMVAFNSTGDFLGPSEIRLPTARIIVSDALEAVDDNVTLQEDLPIVIDVRANDLDVSRSASIVTPVNPPSIGGEIKVADGRIEYSPPPNFFGATSFTYTLRTQDGREDTGTVNLTVQPVNDSPTISNLSGVTIPEGFVFVTNTFSVSPGPLETQPIRVTASSLNGAIVPSPEVEKVADGQYRLNIQPPVGAEGATTIIVSVEDGGLDGFLETVDDNLSTIASFTVTVTRSQRDYGDAPNSSQSGMLSSYPTTLEQDGAFHIGTALRLGDLRDAESNGLPAAMANGDDNAAADDEDGILFPFTQPVNDRVTTTSSYVANVSQSGFLDVWIDFNRDGDWNDPGENVSKKVPVQAGRNLIPFEIPSLPLTGTVDPVFGRFRLSRTGDLPTTGFGGEGEVEDHVMIMNRSFSQELEAYDHILGPHEVKVVDGFLIITVGDRVIYRAPADNISVFRRKNMSGETTFEMREPGRNMPGQLSYTEETGQSELILANSEFDLGQNVQFLVGLNVIRLGQTATPNTLSLELTHVQNLNQEKTLRIEMTKEDSLQTQSMWRASGGRMENGVWVQVYVVTSSSNSPETLATLEVVSEAAWRNETRVTDADGDATTTPLDVLALVNLINQGTIGVGELLPPRTDASIKKFPDVDGDQYLSALDVLQIINYINSVGNDMGGGGEGEGEGKHAMEPYHSVSPVRPQDVDHYMYSYTDDFDQDNRSARRRRSL